MTDFAISFADIEAAAARIKGAAVRTPLIENPFLNEKIGARVFLKAEPLQVTGSFKFRGAYNRLIQLTLEERRCGVVAWSSGNHAQGVAAAASLLGINAAIVMPNDAPQIKIDNTKALGAEIVFYDRYTENREEIGTHLAEKRGATLVPSYDDPHIIAGQGTAGLEIAEQAAEAGVTLDALLVCCGGGGLIAGCATALMKKSPHTHVFAIEPEGFDDTTRSLASGIREKNAPEARSICDALLAPTPGALTFPINKARLAGGVSVTDDEARAAMAYAFRVIKLVIEPGGAVALAALLSGRFETKGAPVGVLLSGGNVTPEIYADVIKS